MDERGMRLWSAALRGSIVILLALLVAGIAATNARAGTYRVVQCNANIDIGRPDVLFGSNTSHYEPSADCDSGGGLAVTHEARSSRHNAWGAWTITAPFGTALRDARATVMGIAQAGHVPELLIGSLGGAVTPLGDAEGRWHRLAWSGADGRALSARLRCRRDSCGAGEEALVAVRRIALTLDDLTSPTLALGGTLFAPGSRRGDQAVAPAVTDTGSGVDRVVVEVNGEPVAAGDLDCDVAGDLALRLRPCPASAMPTLTAPTASAPFAQGLNDVRVCALDYAVDSTANRACQSRTVRIDNACPLSSVPGGTQLVAIIEGGERTRISSDDTATVSGRLLDAQGSPVAGARVCIATRVPLDGEIEGVAATPTTGDAGGFSIELPAGPNREVRVAYWPNEQAAVERMLRLEARVKPTLHLRPHGEVQNGDRVAFATRIPGPRMGDREIRLEVRSDGAWLTLRTGHTDSSGVWRTGYRYHATTGRRRYAFRSFVPAQAGYPYEAGHSIVHHQVVVGK